MKKILYLTTTDWNWIKQRPQFIAEGLAGVFEVTYAYSKTYKTKNNNITKRNTNYVNLHLKQIFRIPFDRFKVIRYINKILSIIQVHSEIKKCDLVWITNPIIYSQLKAIIPDNKLIIYDCMDDQMEFPEIKRDTKKQKWIYKYEKELIEASDHIFFSSDYLSEKVQLRYLAEKRHTIVNNAVSINKSIINDLKETMIINDPKYKDYIKLVYVGTISEWFDFKLITESITRFHNIIYFLAGPCSLEIPLNDRIILMGPIEHNQIIKLLSCSDGLVMPFIGCELILSVNPVKVYEYIYSCKPAIILKYPETDKFDDYVYRYCSGDEYLYYIEKLIEKKLGPKKANSDCILFALNNSWEKRVERIIQELNTIEES
jgi:teichuronic acid biosynthesis glycosyltransferase TuaH